MTIKTQVVKLKVNRTMQKHLDDLCDYRRYCWNKGLEIWQSMYEAYVLNKKDNPSPSWQRVRNEMTADKHDWQYGLSSRCLRLAIEDLGNAWKNFFDKAQPDWGIPKFKSKKATRQGFKTDRAKVVNGKLRLDKPRGVDKNTWFDLSSYEPLKMNKTKVVSIFKEKGVYYAALPYEEEIASKVKTHQKTAVDVNVGHFNYTEGQINVLPARLQKIYKRIKHYQRMLARKREINGTKAMESNSYFAVRTKLQRDYRKVANIQNDIIQKFTTKLVTDYDQILIEDLDVKKMQMTHVASKGLQRSLFGYFRQVLTYKCNWYGKKVVLADKYYPSTQRCSKCGFIKAGEDKVGLNGNQKHRTKHNEYICYECGAIMDRDENAVANLLALLN